MDSQKFLVIGSATRKYPAVLALTLPTLQEERMVEMLHGSPEWVSPLGLNQADQSSTQRNGSSSALQWPLSLERRQYLLTEGASLATLRP